MKVSVITVVFNGVTTITDCLQSVHEQNYPEIEHIVIDGGSTDGTLEALAPFRPRLAYCVSEPDGGIYPAMNKGLRLASGDIVGILNSDDIYADNQVISRVALAFAQNPTLQGVYGNLLYTDKHLKRTVRTWISRAYEPGFFEGGELPPHPTFFVRREVYEQYGFFSEAFPVAADFEMMLRLFRVKQIKTQWLDSVLVKMRVGGESNKSVSNIVRQHKANLAAWKVNGLEISTWGFTIGKIRNRLKQFLNNK